jgi:uncharacterized protein
MEVKQKDDTKKGAFFVEENDKMLAEMTYVWAGSDRIIIDHTEVANELAGKGVGKQMVTKAVEFARQKNIKIIPLCPFAKSVFAKVKEFNDVL